VTSYASAMHRRTRSSMRVVLARAFVRGPDVRVVLACELCVAIAVSRAGAVELIVELARHRGLGASPLAR
jgi:hypothetical protein